MSLSKVTFEDLPEGVKGVERVFGKLRDGERIQVTCRASKYGIHKNYVVILYECDDGGIADVWYDYETAIASAKVHGSNDPLVQFILQKLQELVSKS